MQPEVFDVIAGKHVHFILHSVPSRSTRGPFRGDSFKPDGRMAWLLASIFMSHGVKFLHYISWPPLLSIKVSGLDLFNTPRSLGHLSCLQISL